jgi:hypothetical protein
MNLPAEAHRADGSSIAAAANRRDEFADDRHDIVRIVGMVVGDDELDLVPIARQRGHRGEQRLKAQSCQAGGVAGEDDD